MPVDSIVLIGGFAGAVFYALAHVLLFRLIGTEHIIKWLVKNFVLGVGVILIFYGNVMPFETSGYLKGEIILCFSVSILLYCLLAFFYVLCVIGPYESSIRTRLIRELYRVYPKGIALSGLLERYNAEMILQGRLKRFLGSGEVVKEGEKYRLGKKRPTFFLLEGIARFLRNITKH